MDEVQLERDGAQKPEHAVAESDLHHYKKHAAYEEYDPGELEHEAAELVEIPVINAGLLAPIRPYIERVPSLEAEEHRKRGEKGKKQDISSACCLAKTIGMLRDDDADNEQNDDADIQNAEQAPDADEDVDDDRRKEQDDALSLSSN